MQPTFPGNQSTSFLSTFTITFPHMVSTRVGWSSPNLSRWHPLTSVISFHLSTRCRALILVLLLIGGVHPNPGPSPSQSNPPRSQSSVYFTQAFNHPPTSRICRAIQIANISSQLSNRSQASVRLSQPLVPPSSHPQNLPASQPQDPRSSQSSNLLTSQSQDPPSSQPQSLPTSQPPDPLTS